MAEISKVILGTAATLISSELNSLASGSLAKSSASYNNIDGGGGGDGYFMGMFDFTFSFSSHITQGGLAVWFLGTVDGTNYESGSSTVMPVRPCNLLFKPMNSSFTGSQRIVVKDRLPPGTFYTLVKNEGTGVSLDSSGHSLRVTPFTVEMV